MTLRPGGEAKLIFADSSMHEKLSCVLAVVKKALSYVDEVYKVINEHVGLSGKGNQNALGGKENKEEKTNIERKTCFKNRQKTC